MAERGSEVITSFFMGKMFLSAKFSIILYKKESVYMKVFLENFSAEDTPKILSAVPEVELVNTVEESDFWFTPVNTVDEIISILINGVELEDETEISQEDLQQKKA